MFLSGAYRGWWQQVGWGRQPMGELVLHFVDGQVFGDGRDIIGTFDFRGTYDQQGRLRMTKQYHGKHSVEYEGTYDGEGTINGRWWIGKTTGPFALSALTATPPPDAPIQDLRFTP
jgi:hypothetical protein